MCLLKGGFPSRTRQFCTQDLKGDPIDAHMMTLVDAGHTIDDARWEAGAMADVFEYYAGAANKHLGSVVPTQDVGLGVVMRVPVGVCGLIVPWNFPMLIATWKLAPALAAAATS
jgi:acyl-CoA reductase-like NAD-dependent aldehyde dehydrogenase